MCRLPGDLTGPSASYVIVVRHPRFQRDSQTDWKDADLQHHGRQAADEINYIMESRPERGLCIFMHSHPSPSGASPSNRRCDIQRQRLLEGEPALQIVRHGVDCDSMKWKLPLAHDAQAWPKILQWAQGHVKIHREKSCDAVVQATGLLGDGDEESHASSLLESLTDLGSHECVEESSQGAKRTGEARKECPVPLSDLGRRAWPRGPGQACREDFATPAAVRTLLVELRWRMVDFVAVQVQGKAVFQISGPLLDHCLASTRRATPPGLRMRLAHLPPNHLC